MPINDAIAETLDVLLVEDNPADMRLAVEALKESQVACALHWVKDGVEAVEFLMRQGEYSQAPRPDLILLDLNMPRMDGREVLAIVKSDAQLKRIPVVILTTSNSEDDILKSYDLHANCYITKFPMNFESFVDVFRSIGKFWFAQVSLPPKTVE